MRSMLGAKDPLMWRLVPALVREMGAAYPELIRAEPLITETLRLEETSFQHDARARPGAARRGDGASSAAGEHAVGRRSRSRSTTPTAFRSI